jgi:hypothetical protein
VELLQAVVAVVEQPPEVLVLQEVEMVAKKTVAYKQETQLLTQVEVVVVKEIQQVVVLVDRVL